MILEPLYLLRSWRSTAWRKDWCVKLRSPSGLSLIHSLVAERNTAQSKMDTSRSPEYPRLPRSFRTSCSLSPQRERQIKHRVSDTQPFNPSVRKGIVISCLIYWRSSSLKWRLNNVCSVVSTKYRFMPFTLGQHSNMTYILSFLKILVKKETADIKILLLLLFENLNNKQAHSTGNPV